MSGLVLLNNIEVKKKGHKRKNKKKDEFRKKLMIPDSEIPECPEREIK